MDDFVGGKRETIERIASKHGARNLRLFGSRVRGDARPDSDVDLLVEMEPGRSLLDLIGFEQELEETLGVEVDVLTLSSISPYIRDEVEREAVPF